MNIMDLFAAPARNRLLQPAQDAAGVGGFSPANQLEAAAMPESAPPEQNKALAAVNALIQNGANPFEGVLQPIMGTSGGSFGLNPMQQQAAQGSQAVDPIQTGGTAIQQPKQGFMDKAKGFLGSENAQDMFAGWMMGGNDWQKSLAMGAMNASQGRRARGDQNQTVNWLKSKGYDDGMARQIAGNPATLQQVLKNLITPQDPKDALQLEKLQLEVDGMRNPGQTDTQRNLAWRAQEAGLQPGTPEYSQFMQSGGSVPQTTVNVGAGEKAWDQESAKLFAKRYDDISAGAMNAQQMLGMYDLAEQALNSGVRTGLGAETELSMRQLGAAMGIDTDPEKLAGGELIRAVQNRMALTMRSPDGGMGMPGALSDRDIKFLKDSQVGIDRSPAGNRRMLEAFRAMENRKVELAKLADQYVQQNGRLDAGFNQAVREYAESNPLFPQEPTADGGAGAAPAGIDPNVWQHMTPEERMLWQ